MANGSSKLLVAGVLCCTALAASPFGTVLQRAKTKGVIRVAWMGTSIAGGMGTAPGDPSRIDAQVNAFLKQRFGVKVVSRNFFFGGAPSIVHLAILKTSVLPWNPDIIFAELGTMDEFSPELSAPSIDSFVKLSDASGAAPVIWHPFTSYSRLAVPFMERSASTYGARFVDMGSYIPAHSASASFAEDTVHPTKAGRDLIAVALTTALMSDEPRARVSAHPVEWDDTASVRFQPASIPRGDNSRTPRFFDSAGFAARFRSESTIVERFRGQFFVALFVLGGAPDRLAYRIDDGQWITAAPQPYWFLAYSLASGLPDKGHVIEMRLTPRLNQPAIVDGYLVNR